MLPRLEAYTMINENGKTEIPKHLRNNVEKPKPIPKRLKEKLRGKSKNCY
jgi:hypothetical protein